MTLVYYLFKIKSKTNLLIVKHKRRRLSPYASRFTTNHNCIWENLHQLWYKSQ